VQNQSRAPWRQCLRGFCKRATAVIAGPAAGEMDHPLFKSGTKGSEMPYKSVFPLFVIGALALGFTANPAFSATLTTSIAVTATVEAGCQVSPSPSAPKYSASQLTDSRDRSSVSCSMAVPYQVVVAISPQAKTVEANSPEIDASRFSEYAQSNNLSLPQLRQRPYAVERIVSSDSGSPRGLFPASFSETPEDPSQAPYRVDSGTVVMTVMF